MSTVLLFCIAAIPSATINALFEVAGSNTFMLVRNPSHTVFNDTRPPLAEIESGFTNCTHSEIQEFVSEHLKENIPGTFLEPNHYAILDEDSMNNNTVVIGAKYSPLQEQEAHLMDDDEYARWEAACEEYEAAGDFPDMMWREWRVAFAAAERMQVLLLYPSDSSEKLYHDKYVNKYTDNRGIFHLDAAVQAWDQEAIDEGREEDDEESD